jgi:hypothetical protein
MAEFIYAGGTLATKTDLAPIPVSADPTKWFRAEDYTSLRQALLDTRSAVLAGRLHGFTGEATRPSVAGATRFLWVDSDDNKVYYYNGTSDVDLTAGTEYTFSAEFSVSLPNVDLATVLDAHTFRDAAAATAGVTVDKNLVATANNKAISVTRQAGAVAFGVELGATDIPYLYSPIDKSIHVGNIAAKSDRSIAELTLFRNQTSGASQTDFMLRFRRGAPGAETGDAFIGIDDTNSMVLGVTARKLTVTSSGATVNGTFQVDAGLATLNEGLFLTDTGGSPSAVTNVATLRNTASGSAATGHGTGILWEGKTSTGAYQSLGDTAFVASDVTNGAVDAYWIVRAAVNGTLTEVARFDPNAGSTITGNLTVTGTLAGYVPTTRRIIAGSGITVSGGGGGSNDQLTADLTIAATGGGSAHVIQSPPGSSLAARANLTFDGTELIATDDAGNNQTDVTMGAVLGVKTFSLSDAGTNTTPTLATLRHLTSGTAAAGFGGTLLMRGEDDGGGESDLAAIVSAYSVVTAGSEKSYVALQSMDGAAGTAALASSLWAWGSGRVGIGALGATEPSATFHVRSASSAAAAFPVAIWDKQSGGALASNRLAEFYRDTATTLGFIQADASDNLAISSAANKALIFAVNGVTQASVTNTVTTVNGAFRHAGSTLGFFSATAVARSATPFTLNAGTLAHDLPASPTAQQVGDVLRQLLTYLGDVSGYGLINVTA